jgi:PKD repeat protein
MNQLPRLADLLMVTVPWRNKTCILLWFWLWLYPYSTFAAQITLSWRDPNNAPQEISGYHLYYWQDDWDAPARVAVPPTAIPYTLTGLEAGQTYYFAVTAYGRNRAQESARSNTVRKTIPVLAPMASFRATSATTGPRPLTVNFADTSTGNITSRSWTFGDGRTSTAKNPRHTYAAAGTYTVKLRVRGQYGADTAIRRGYITVSAKTTGLVAAYNFDTGRGTTVPDLSGNAHHGRISGATWTPAGKYGQALAFDGVDDWVTIAATPLLDLSPGATLMAWVYPTATSGVRDILLKEGSGVDIYNLYARNWRGRPESNVYVNSANRVAEGARLPTRAWTHVAGTYNGSVLRLYLNGVEVARRSVTGSLASSRGPVRIGGNRLWGEYFQGRIDEVRIYNRALTAAEIRGDMRAPVTALPTDHQSLSVSITTPGHGTTVSRSSVLGAATASKNVRKTVPTRLHTVLLPDSTAGSFEFGEVQIGPTWRTITFRRPFIDPIVVARPPSNHDLVPALVQMRNITPTGFEIRMQQRDDVDRVHNQEMVGYLVVEQGQHTLGGTIPIEASSLVTHQTHSFVTVPFAQSFSVAPVVLTAVVSANGRDAVTTRVRNVTLNNFQVRLQAQQKNSQSQAAETIMYIAWPSSSGRLADNLVFEVQQTPNIMPHRLQTLTFMESFTALPVFLADLQTANGSNPASLHWANRGFFGVDVQVAAPQSTVGALQHTTEVVGYLALAVHDATTDSDGDGLTNADEVLRYGTDPADVDTDQDGLDDGDEVQFWGTRWNADPDGDGLSNLLDLDSDDDGILDGEALPCRVEARPPAPCPR